jgi:hypothetical protein
LLDVRRGGAHPIPKLRRGGRRGCAHPNPRLRRGAPKRHRRTVTEVAPVLPAVIALCSRSAARLRYLSYSAPKP